MTQMNFLFLFLLSTLTARCPDGYLKVSEIYVDSNSDGIYNEGEKFRDSNLNDMWDNDLCLFEDDYNAIRYFYSNSDNLFQSLLTFGEQIWERGRLVSWICNGCDIKVNLSDRIGSFTKIRKLDLAKNSLSGKLPDSIKKLREIEYLNLQQNKIDSVLPNIFSNLKKLRYLNLRGNKIYGTLPSSLFNLKNLESLNLVYNELSGKIPSSIKQLKKLEYLNLGGNFFDKQIPNEITELKHLSILYLFKNSFTGPIPIQLGRMESIQKISLADNRLSGEIPDELGDLNMKKNFGSIDLSNNLLSGTLSNSMCRLIESNIKINLSGNLICGPYPDCILEILGYQDVTDCF